MRSERKEPVFVCCHETQLEWGGRVLAIWMLDELSGLAEGRKPDGIYYGGYGKVLENPLTIRELEVGGYSGGECNI